MEKDEFKFRDYDPEDPPRFNEWVRLYPDSEKSVEPKVKSVNLAATAVVLCLIAAAGYATHWIVGANRHKGGVDHNTATHPPVSSQAKGSDCRLTKLTVGVDPFSTAQLHIYLDRDAPTGGVPVEISHSSDQSPVSTTTVNVTALEKVGHTLLEPDLPKDQESWIRARVANASGPGIAIYMPFDWNQQPSSVRVDTVVIDKPTAIKVILNHPPTRLEKSLSIEVTVLGDKKPIPINVSPLQAKKKTYEIPVPSIDKARWITVLVSSPDQPGIPFSP